MSFVINTNVDALYAQNYLSDNKANLSKAIQRLSSGKRINSPADDPAGLAISTGLTNSANGLLRGAANANDGISLIQTALSATNDINGLVGQMQTIATQASSGTYSSTQLGNLDTQFQALLSEVNRVASTAAFNGISVLANSTGSVSIQVGNSSTSNDTVSITLTNLTTGSSGLNIASLAVDTQSNGSAALAALSAITSITTSLAQLGANESNLSAAAANSTNVATAFQAANSRILDADYAAESSNQAKYNILVQSSIAMLAQANSSPQAVLQLLKG